MKKTFLFFILLFVNYSNYAQIDFQLLWTGFTNDNTVVDYSPDGNLVLTYTPANGLVKVYDANSGAQIWANSALGGGRFSPDGSKVVGINSFNNLCIYNSYTGALIWKDTLSNISDYIMSPNSNYIISSIYGGINPARLYNLNNGNIVWVKNNCFPLDISFDNTKFSYFSNITGTDSIIISELITGNQIWGLPTNSNVWSASGFSPDNNFFAISSTVGIKFFESNTGILSSIIPDNNSHFVKYSEDNLKIFGLNESDEELYCYNAQTHILMCVISNEHFFHNYWYETIFTDSLSNNVAIFGDYSGFGVFNTNNGILIGSDNVSQQFSSTTNPIYLTNLALSPDGTKIFTAEEEHPSYAHTVKMWSINATGISNINNQNSFYKIYPVPVAQNLSIEIMNESKVERIELFDLQGKLLSTQNSEGKKFSLDVHSLISGTYLLKLVYDDGKIDLEKIIKE